MLELSSLKKSYGTISALTNVALQAEAGDVYGYVGPNGAGKTTTIKIITGLITLFDGTVVLDEYDVRKHPAEVRKRIGYVPQDVGFQEWRTVEHALTTFASLSGLSGSRIKPAVDRVLEQVGIREHRKRRIVHLSGGTVQRLRLAQALLHEPKLLVMDEPLSGLDPTSRHQVTNTITQLAAEGRIVFVSSHILAELEGIATKIGVLSGGHIVEEGTPSELRERHQVGTVIRLELLKTLEIDQIEALARLPVRLEKEGPQSILLHVNTGTSLETAMPATLKTLVESHVPVRSVSHVQPSLTDVYLKLTREVGA